MLVPCFVGCGRFRQEVAWPFVSCGLVRAPAQQMPQQVFYPNSSRTYFAVTLASLSLILSAHPVKVSEILGHRSHDDGVKRAGSRNVPESRDTLDLACLYSILKELLLMHAFLPGCESYLLVKVLSFNLHLSRSL